jgi:peptidoglycan L-alanyl-D-glutamate endopeptidase CwlK
MSRKIEDLDPIAQEKCNAFIAACKEKGIDLMLTSTFRTEAEQLAYFAQGRKTLKAVNEFRREAGLCPITPRENIPVTKNLTSVHQFGFAFDVAIKKAGLAIWEIKVDLNDNQIPDYEEIGKIGEALGLRWGGRWKDYCHFEYTGGLTILQLQAGMRPAKSGESRA